MSGNRGSVRYDARGNGTYTLNGVEVTKAEFDAAFPPKELGVPSAAAPSCWPMTSEALAVHPDQVAEANARNKRHGVNATYEPGTGMCLIPDRGERKRLLKLEGFKDRSGGYGD